jgi:hypothetical protein
MTNFLNNLPGMDSIPIGKGYDAGPPHDPRTGQFGHGGPGVVHSPHGSKSNKQYAEELAEFEKQNAGNVPAPRRTEAGATTRSKQIHGPLRPGESHG